MAYPNYPNIQRWPHYRGIPFEPSRLEMRSAIFSVACIQQKARHEKLAPRLRHANWNTPIHYDFAQSPGTLLLKYLFRAERLLFCPAVSPHQERIRLIIRTDYLEYPLEVLPSYTRRKAYVTVWDVLSTIHYSLLQPISPWMARYIYQNCKCDQRQYAAFAGCRKIDLLKGRTRFSGLSSRHTTHEYVLHFK